MIEFPVIVTAVVSSFLLGLLAMGFTLQYITLSVPNLAYGTIAFFTTYVTLTVTLLGLPPYVALPFAFLLAGSISFLLYKFMAFLRNRGMPLTALMISTLVFDFVIGAIMNIYADYISYTMKVFARMFSLTENDFSVSLPGGLHMPGILPVSMLASILIVLIFHTALVKTKFGIAMRAVMENYSMAGVQGINTERVLGFSWFFVGGIAGIAGSLYPMWFFMDPTVGTVMFVSIFASCVVGGLKSMYGSLVGGIVIGFSETFVTYGLVGVFGTWLWIYKSITPMLIAAISLMVMPQGFGGLVSRLKER
jgi:branched-chain amino acid transport system permease protein